MLECVFFCELAVEEQWPLLELKFINATTEEVRLIGVSLRYPLCIAVQLTRCKAQEVPSHEKQNLIPRTRGGQRGDGTSGRLLANGNVQLCDMLSSVTRK